ncbi:DegT/DnrJ/EryC1/StrS family aminotransferase [Hydrogenoanaerobacterium sp.]|uniref:DegT/DnrJ/EryC1/StrS family aminotransferase n=1 Tax=Hydrogenoanaerobacterium sp. TaxID=2953763 RepID=UPI0028A2D36D|nr:DegT/DnrJ/EryC1/StrS family aminotransferase [Hydrogenoanaerobacterium sp.]
MNIPLIDLARRYAVIKPLANKAVLDVLESGHYIQGENVKAFEREFAAYLSVGNAVSVANGTDALIIALKALGIGDGDEVLTSPFTFFATAEAISAVGAVPVFVDVRPDTCNIDESKLEAKITPKTKAIMPVHIFGLPAEMDVIHRIAKRHRLYVIEDACQAAGAVYMDKKAGALGDIACFSFFPTKNLSCAGDGGIIVTNSSRLACICRALATHGSGENGHRAYNYIHHTDEPITSHTVGDTVYQPAKYHNYLIGGNSRLDELQAAILRIQLAYLDQNTVRRNIIAGFYDSALRGLPLTLPLSPGHIRHAYHMYVLQSERRNEIVKHLAEKGIATGIYYPVPLHLQRAYEKLDSGQGTLPVAEALAKRTFAIPMFPELTDEEVEYIAQTLRGACE